MRDYDKYDKDALEVVRMFKKTGEVNYVELSTAWCELYRLRTTGWMWGEIKPFGFFINYDRDIMDMTYRLCEYFGNVEEEKVDELYEHLLAYNNMFVEIYLDKEKINEGN